MPDLDLETPLDAAAQAQQRDLRRTDYLSARLRTLAAEMEEVGGLLTRFEDRERWLRHGIELEGAARMARDWADGLDREGRGEGTGHES